MSTATRTLVNAIEAVASQRGNTVSICRECYICLAVIDAQLDASLSSVYASERARARRQPSLGLTLEEPGVLGCSKRWLYAKEQLAA